MYLKAILPILFVLAGALSYPVYVIRPSILLNTPNHLTTAQLQGIIDAVAGGKENVLIKGRPDERLPRCWLGRLSPDALEYLRAHDEVFISKSSYYLSDMM